MLRDFPGCPVVKNPPSNAGDMGSIPGGGTKIPHATGQLSPRTTTTELACLNETASLPQTIAPTFSGARAHNKRREKPHATTREKPACPNEKSRMLQQRSCVLQLRHDAAKKTDK